VRGRQGETERGRGMEKKVEVSSAHVGKERKRGGEARDQQKK
jgi:hypothetical protein